MSVYRDRDLVQDENGDIYQILGSIHPIDRVYALEKYSRVREDYSQAHPDQFLWTRKPTGEKFIRKIRQYTARTAADVIHQNPYRSYSSLFQTEMLLLPQNKIRLHWDTLARFSTLYSRIFSGTFQERQQLDTLEREIVEIGVTLMDECHIPLYAIGITGSLLWEGQHIQSDLDLMVYGRDRMHAVEHWLTTLSTEGSGVHRLRPVEVLPLAGKLAQKTGLSNETCLEIVFRKHSYLKYRNRMVTINYAPTPEEIVLFPAYYPDSQFEALRTVTVTAKILSEEWGLFVPGLFEIRIEDAESQVPPLPPISRLLVFDQDINGYYHKGDRIQIQGLLQHAKGVPGKTPGESIDTYQIAVGTRENYGNEYVKLV